VGKLRLFGLKHAPNSQFN